MLMTIHRGRFSGIQRLCACTACLLTLSLLPSVEVLCSEREDTGAKQEEGVLSLTLEEALNLALQANRNLRFSASSLESQRLSLTSAESEFELKLLPSTSANFSDDLERLEGGISLEKKFGIGLKAALSPRIEKLDLDDDSEESYSGAAGGSLGIPLLRGFGKEVTLDSVRGSRFSVRTAERSLYVAKVHTVLDTVFGVYNVIEQKELVQLYSSLVERLQGHAETARIKEKVGLASSIDVYRAEIRLKDAEDGLAQAREALRDAGDALKLVLAVPLKMPIQVTAPIEYEPIDIDMDSAVEIASRSRVELEQSKDEIREAERRSRVSKNNLLPGLDLALNYERFGYSDDFSRSTRLDEDRWSINLVSTTDWARTAEKAAYEQSLIGVRTARLDLELKQDEITRDVRRQLDALRKAEERIKIREEQIRQAEGKLALARVKFNHGMADNFDVIEAETELQRSRVDLLSVKTEYIVGTYNMRAVLGTLIEQ